MGTFSFQVDEGLVGLLAGLNLLIDALVTDTPELAEAIIRRIDAKLAEERAEPTGISIAPILLQMRRALTSSGRALQRQPPSGSA